MEMKSPPPCPNTVTVRRNPPRRARPTPSSTVPLPMPLSSPSVPRDVPSFPIEDILCIEVQENPKRDLSTQEPLAENMKVFLRIRPLQTAGKFFKSVTQAKNAWPKNLTTKNTSKSKVKKNSEVCVTLNDSHSVTLCPPQNLRDLKRVKSEVFEGFSHVFSSESSQNEVYENMVKPLVEDFLRGKSGMLAALGPSGSGKTHTVFGCPREPGMVPLALRQIFSQTDGCGAQSSRTFYLSMFEIYSEKGKAERILDLSQDGVDLCLQQSMIKGLQEATINDVQQAESLIANGMLKRSKAMTNSNSQSSRSQCIINIHNVPSHIDTGDQSNSAVLTIVDLAGAEREKRTGNQGARLLESNFINNTSMVFGLCLRSLLEHQKNPRRPLQKHFQNSLLTRYLRDYLEGKKRMTLILTVKPGEEDYLDTSFLLRQASPYMKIKYSNIEEPFNLISSKRQIQALPRLEQLKRMKFSGNEACLVDERKGNVVHQRHKEEVKQVKTMQVLVESPKCTDGALLKEDCNELKKSERNNQIMQGFAKALWNILKEYKKKLEDAENEIYDLRDSVSKEKARCSDLESELNDLKSFCSCWKEASTVASLVEVDENRANLSLDLKGYQITSAEVGPEVSSLNCDVDAEVSLDQKVSEQIDTAQTSDVTECKSTTEMVNNTGDSETYNCCRSKDNIHYSEEATGLNLKQSAYAKNEQRYVAIERNSVADIALCSAADTIEEQCHQIHESSPEIDSAEDLKELRLTEKDIVHSSVDTTRFGSGGLSESADSFSESLAIISDGSSSSVEINQPQKEKEKWLKPAVTAKDDVTCAQEGDDAHNASKLVSCCIPLNTEKPKRRLLPASSILLRDMVDFDFDDENDRPKGSGRERKAAADDTKRTQGSISLLRLLRSNLPK